jgi:hypothetical protein
MLQADSHNFWWIKLSETRSNQAASFTRVSFPALYVRAGVKRCKLCDTVEVGWPDVLWVVTHGVADSFLSCKLDCRYNDIVQHHSPTITVAECCAFCKVRTLLQWLPAWCGADV